MATSTTVSFSQFNASLNRNTEGQLVTDLSTPNNAQAKAVAEIIQRNNPDVLLINEFDYAQANPLQAVQLLQQNYLGVSQNGATPVNYPHVYIAPSNTGIPSGFDLNNNGATVTTPGTPGYGDDAFGFGNFPGQFGMLLLSKYPIDTANIRTFQNFLWKDMPDSLLPTISLPGSGTPWYSPEEQAVLRLSSKSHWDVPIIINGETVHVLASHPTPPTFDGAEDRNGKRNADEIRFWSDYITPGKGSYIYDDKGKKGGLATGSSFVIMGDQNADPFDGDSFNNAILQLLQNPAVNTNSIPSSVGGPQQATLQGGANANHRGNPAFDTADFNDTAPGNLRTDYVLPSTDLQITNSRVYWPLNTDPNFAAVGVFNSALPGGFPSSDHRLVLTQVQVGATEAGKTVADVDFIGERIFETNFTPTGAAGSVNGTAVPLGGLSSVTYDAANNRYYAISDDRSSNARFYTFTTDVENIATSGVTFTNAVSLKDASGNLFAPNALDPEGIALTRNNTVFISSEGEVSSSRVINPFVNEFDLTTGRQIRALPVPTKFNPILQGSTQTSGVRNNLAFESLTISPDQKTLYTATENALFQDGPFATTTNGSRSRILQYNLTSGQPEKEYLYITDAVAVAPNPTTAFSTNGLVDLLAIDNRGTMLAVERSFSLGVPGTGNTIKIYEVSLQGATDISTINSLSTLSESQLAAIKPVQKRLLLNLDDLSLPRGTDNIEGITFGPKLADGSQSIVLVSDNNFSPTQFTQILTLSGDVVPTVTPTVETRPEILDDDSLPVGQAGDADDPAIYVNATNPAQSLVLGTVKNAGLRVYDLAGNLLQEINPGSIRYNNVDLQYGFKLGNQTIDIAVASDRNNDRLAIFQINANPTTGGQYLQDITDSSIGTLFQALPFTAPYSPSTRSAYGITLYRSPVTKDFYAFVNRRQTGDVVQLRLVDKGNGKIGAERVRNFTVPTTTGREAQLEGMVVDQETGFLYVGQEDVGIWKYLAEPNGGSTGTLIDAVKDVGGENLEADVEGLTIYYGKNGTGYLLASSQGDNTFAAYTRDGNNDFIGRFAVGNNDGIDSVQESDGADVVNVPLGSNFPNGLFVTQDGDNLPGKIVDDENVSTNFKFVPWENIANSFSTPLNIDTTSYNPRTPKANSLLNGVASGDTTQTSTVLWARSNFTGPIAFEYSTRPDFSTIAGKTTAGVTNALVPVKVDVLGLTPATQYYYRATDAAGASATGQFKTSATIGTSTGVRFGVTGDWRGELAPYPAIANAPGRKLDFFVGLGDTIYADYPSPAVKNPDGTEKEQTTTLAEYRAKHAEVYGQRYGQNTWADLRASTSILATIDDHEVVNDFQGGQNLATASPATQAFFGATSGLVNDSPLFEIGLQSFQEYNPIQDKFYGATADSRTAQERQLYRYNTYGSDAATFLLDARSFRDEELAGVANPTDQTQIGNFLAQSFNPSRTMLGKQQLADLKRDLLKAQSDGVVWKFIIIPEPIQNLGVVGASDRFEGYAAERTEILKFINDNKISNAVFVAADIHGTVVNNLTYQTAPGQAQIATSAFEITTGAVAFDAPFGPTVAELAAAAGLLTPTQKAFYDSLPIANDADSTPNDKDDFIKGLVNNTITPLGYDPLGLDNNLAQANNLINAKLLQGDYVAAHTYGWTEFNIDQQTQKLTVTTYGVDAYTREQLEANPTAITNLQPKVVSQFEVTPNKTTTTPTPTPTGTTFTRTNDVFTLAGGSGRPKLSVSVTGRSNNSVDELGVFTVDDAQGRINGIAPGQPGYTDAALGRSRSIVGALANVPTGFQAPASSLEFTGDSNLRFFAVRNSTVDAVRAGKTPTSNVIFSNSSIQDLGNGAFGVGFNEFAVRVQPTTDALPLGANLQGRSQAEVLDLRGTSQQVRANFTVNREAAFNNYVGFYRVADENGGIDTNSDGRADITPGQAGYAQAAVRSRVAGIDLTVNNQGQATFNDRLLTGGAIYAPFIISNATPDQVLNSGASNVYFAYLGANPDGQDHIRLLGNNTFGFEDLPNGGDFDYNDVTIRVNLTTA
jgi:3-phytase/alkaline phosphatase D